MGLADFNKKTEKGLVTGGWKLALPLVFRRGEESPGHPTAPRCQSFAARKKQRMAHGQSAERELWRLNQAPQSELYVNYLSIYLSIDLSVCVLSRFPRFGVAIGRIQWFGWVCSKVPTPSMSLSRASYFLKWDYRNSMATLFFGACYTPIKSTIAACNSLPMRWGREDWNVSKSCLNQNLRPNHGQLKPWGFPLDVPWNPMNPNEY